MSLFPCSCLAFAWTNYIQAASQQLLLLNYYHYCYYNYYLHTDDRSTVRPRQQRLVYQLTTFFLGGLVVRQVPWGLRS